MGVRMRLRRAARGAARPGKVVGFQGRKMRGRSLVGQAAGAGRGDGTGHGMGFRNGAGPATVRIAEG